MASKSSHLTSDQTTPLLAGEEQLSASETTHLAGGHLYDGVSSVPDPQSSEAPQNLSQLLYISHFLSTWNSRLFEFGAILFVASIFVGTLLPTSAYALARAAAAIIFSPMVGSYIDVGSRLLMQRFAVALSCIGFWVLKKDLIASESVRIAVLTALALLACVEKLGSVMNTVAVEKDWVVVVASNTTIELRGGLTSRAVLNSQMRRIDLFCKLMGPLVIALIDGLSTEVAIMATFGLSVLSVGLEYWAIARVYKRVPALQADKSTTSSEAPGDVPRVHPARRSMPLLSWIRPATRSLKFYYQHPAFTPSFSLSVLYFTVLSFSGQMVTYLLTVGYNSVHIGLVRTLSSLSEMSATWIAPRVMARLGPLRAAMWFLSWQIICLAIGTALFLGAAEPFVAASGLVGGVIGSRVGLWGFDLCVQIIIQEEVEPNYRGTFSSIEASVQNFFALDSYASTMIFSQPEEFQYPVIMSAVAVLFAGQMYARFLRSRRGHLLHIPKCICLKEQAELERQA
ncbi:hypothetical protein DXG01_012268 [Tephrocybe rancida]|nr:hypothetical protein DXG01_012268 [Tephrocybe rancida]